jgi:hypothetical protein
VVGFGDFHSFLLVDVILNHEREVLHFLFFESFFIDRLTTDLSRQNLQPYIVIPLQHELHLVQYKVDFLLVLQRPVCLDLDLLNRQGSLISLAVFLQHLNKSSRAVSVLPLQEHLTLACLSQNLQERKLVLTRWQLV